jgi:hypothetical protein
MSGVTVKDCDAAEFIKALAEHFKQVRPSAKTNSSHTLALCFLGVPVEWWCWLCDGLP